MLVANECCIYFMVSKCLVTCRIDNDRKRNLNRNECKVTHVFLIFKQWIRWCSAVTVWQTHFLPAGKFASVDVMELKTMAKILIGIFFTFERCSECN